MSSTRFPSVMPGYTRTHTKSFSYAQGGASATNAPPAPPPSVPPQPTSFPSSKGDPATSHDALAALNMLTEILREELFLQSEEIRLADRPPERLAKLREAHKEWVVWRVRKELDKLRMWDRPGAASPTTTPTVDKAAKADQAKAAEQKRREEERRQQDEAQRHEREEKSRERERTLKEERDRAAREREAQSQTRSRTPGGTSTGPSFPWQRRFTSSSGAHQRSSSSASNAHPAAAQPQTSSHGYARAFPDTNAGYGTDRESSRTFEAPPRSHTTAPNSAANREWNREALIAKSGWDAYQSRWNALNASASNAESTTSLRGLRFGDIPWPIFSNGPFTPVDITSKTVGAFLLSPFHSVDKSTKERLRAALIQWHPDKFEARWLAAIADSEKPLVREGVGAVARAVNDLMAANR